jgi:very-short-patch-repair endonuclease
MGERGRRWAALRERKLAALAGAQHGVITRRQLLDGGVGARTIERRVERRQLHRLHGGIYSYGDPKPNFRGRWLAAVLACGDGAVLSHRSAAALWGLARAKGGPVEVTAVVGRRRPGIALHECGLHKADRVTLDSIPVTSVARTLFDLAEVVDERQLGQAFEEADRLRLLEMRALEDVCARGRGRRALAPVRRLIDEARAPGWTRSDLEDRFAALCREHELRPTDTNVEVLGHEVDALWACERLVVELDGFAHHRHRAAFERDRARDAAMQAAGYRVIRITDRRLKREPTVIAAEIRSLLGSAQRSRRAGS